MVQTHSIGMDYNYCFNYDLGKYCPSINKKITYDFNDIIKNYPLQANNEKEIKGKKGMSWAVRTQEILFSNSS